MTARSRPQPVQYLARPLPGFLMPDDGDVHEDAGRLVMLAQLGEYGIQPGG
jgi:hypothetical protein